ncbi:MAG: methyltransferase domain-containing protein [Halioglobus sp.]
MPACGSKGREGTTGEQAITQMSKSRGNTVSRTLRKGTRFLWAKESPTHLESIRLFELAFARHAFPRGGALLEIGAGTGWQAHTLQAWGFAVDAIDLPTSNYRESRIFPVVDYDGHHIPFPDQTFDVVFSSNVLEHIPHVEAFQQEIHRVLKPGGVAVHILPSSTWRFWTNISHVLKSWKIPEIHGEHADNALHEIALFRRRWWRQLFERTGWEIVAVKRCPLFYTGRSIMGQRIGIGARQRLGRILGGSTNLFVLRAART